MGAVTRRVYRWFASVAVLFWAPIVFGAFATPHAPNGPEKPVIRFGVIPRCNPLLMVKSYQPIMDYLTEVTPYRFELKLAKNYEDAVAFLRSGEVEFASPGDVLVVASDPAPFREMGYTAIQDEYPEGGPLGALTAGLKHIRGHHAFAAGADMPFPHPRVVRHLYGQRNGWDVVVARSTQGFEPLCAIYSKTCVAPMEERVGRGEAQGPGPYLRRSDPNRQWRQTCRLWTRRASRFATARPTPISTTAASTWRAFGGPEPRP